MTEDNNYQDKKRLDFSVRYQIEENTTDALLLKFLQSYPFGNHKELILQAIRAFWLPLAYQQSGQYSTEEVLDIGKKAMDLLNSQADYISLILGLKQAPTIPLNQSEKIEEDEVKPVLRVLRRQLRNRHLFTDDEFKIRNHIQNDLAIGSQSIGHALPPLRHFSGIHSEDGAD